MDDYEDEAEEIDIYGDTKDDEEAEGGGAGNVALRRLRLSLETRVFVDEGADDEDEAEEATGGCHAESEPRPWMKDRATHQLARNNSAERPVTPVQLFRSRAVVRGGLPLR